MTKITLEFEAGVVESLLHKLQYEGRELIQRYGKEDLIIYMPKYINDCISKGLIGRNVFVDNGGIDTFRGIRVMDGYENKLVLSHRDSVLRMIPVFKVDIP